MRVRAFISVCGRLVGAGVFVYTGWHKALDPGQLQIDIQRYPVLTDGLAWAMAAYLPYLEILSAGALCFQRSFAAGRVVIGALLLLFIVALVSAWIRGLNIECGCFSSEAAGEPRYAWWITRDLALLALLFFSGGTANWSHVVEPTADEGGDIQKNSEA